MTIPIAGKMSDRFGRRSVFLVGIGLFLGGSIVAGMSNSMEMLIACRFVQGIGAGVIMPVAMATVADLYAPSELGRMQGLLGAVFAVASVIGPLLGGFIVENMSWRWVFYVNLPVGILAIALTATKFPKHIKETTKRMDFQGMAALATSLSTFLLVLTWGGTTYSWESLEIVGLSLLSVMALIAFITIERKAEDPILPLRLFHEPIFTLSSAGLMIVGVGLFGVISFLPMFLQAVIGMSPTNSGETLIPLMIGLMLTVVISGFLLKRTGYKVWLVAGPPVSAVGLYLLSTLNASSSQTEAIIYTLIIGMGIGMVMSNYMVATQNVTSKKDMGVVTSSLTLFRSLGSAMGVAFLGSVINRQMAVELGKNLPAGAAAILPATDVNTLGGLLLNPIAAAQIPAPILEAIRLSLSNSMTYMFLIAGVIVLCAIVASLFIKNVPLKTADEYHENESREIMSPNLYKRILIPTDGSKYSRTAVEHALEVAIKSNAEVTVLNVMDTKKVSSTLSDLTPTSQTSSMVISSEAVIEEATTMAKKRGVKVDTKVRTGDPANIINELSGDYDLIIMGTRGLHGLPHLLLGSVAEKVARESKCPVMVVKDRGLVYGPSLPDVSRAKTPLKHGD